MLLFLLFQANHFQSELESANTQLEAMRTSTRQITSELSDVVAENKRLQVDLEQGEGTNDRCIITS